MDEELDRTEEHEGPHTPTSLSFLNVKNRLIRFEGWARHLYMDNDGNFSVGVGFLLPNKSALGSYRWQEKKTKRRVNDRRLVEKDWDAVKVKGKGYKLYIYDRLTNFEISDSDVSRILKVKMYRFDADIRRVFREEEIDYDSLPSLVKEAIFDIAWTVGPNDFKQHWPKFKAALKRRDWSEAAAQSRRDPSQIPLKRNQEIKNLIRQQVFFDEQENGSYTNLVRS